ncbi:MAG: TonB family protein [Sinimarinibacterium sp.]|jgi:TonB family protein
MSDSDASNTGVRGFLAGIAKSAEYSIAAALLAVCLVVGGVLWWLQPQETQAPATPETSPSATTVPAGADESAALAERQRRLGEQFGAIEEQQRRRGAEDDARRARQRAEDDAAEARRQAELAAQARQQAEARARELAGTPKPAATTPAPSPVPQPRSEPVVVDAAIDWSSCRRPSYPSQSVSRGEEGVVTIAVDLDAAARILQARVAQSSGYARLDRVTLEAVGKCRFTPAREDGVAKAATADVRFTWKLQD